MSTLKNKKIKDTYEGLLKTSTNLALDGTLTQIQDGTGQDSNVKINNLGDIELNKLKFTKLEDSNAVEINDFLVSSEPFVAAANTKIPTVESVKNYVDSEVTSQDLDFTANSGTGDVDLDSEVFDIRGVNGINTSANVNTLTIDGIELEDGIATNVTNIATNATDIAANTTNITTNAGDINTNANNIAINVGAISVNSNDISTNADNIAINSGLISDNAVDIQTNVNSIVTNATNIATNVINITDNADTIEDNATDINTINTTAEFLVNKGEPSGYVPLDASSKILETYLPASVIGGLKYIGTWDALNDTPTLPSATTNNGSYYIVSVAGTYLSVSYGIGDWIVSNGVDYQKIDNTDSVSTVFGRVGNILANSVDYDAFYPTLTNLPSLITNNTSVAANTLKVGITTQQAADIVTNNDKVGITTAQADEITANTLKDGITTAQADAIVVNSAKVGITTAQADEIVVNSAKVGITTAQADEIAVNTLKDGITTAQANEITANTLKTGITTAQSNEITANTLKVGITTAQADEITANTAKTGITTAQANEITANTLKVGITTAQADEIAVNTLKVGYTEAAVSANASVAANTAKVGITTQQAADIVVNNGKVGITTDQTNAIISNTNNTASNAVAITGKVAKTGDIMTGDLRITSNSTTALVLSSTQARLGIRRNTPEAALDVGGNARVRGSLNVGLTNEQYLFVSTTGDTPVGYVKMGRYGKGLDYDTTNDPSATPQYTSAFGEAGRVVEDIRYYTFKLTRLQMAGLNATPKTLIPAESGYNFFIEDAYFFQNNNGGFAPVYNNGNITLDYVYSGGSTVTAASVDATITNSARGARKIIGLQRQPYIYGASFALSTMGVQLNAPPASNNGSGNVAYFLRLKVKKVNILNDISANSQIIVVS